MKKFLLYVLPIFICSNSYAIDFSLELKVNPFYTDCSIDESSPTKRLIDSVFKKNIIELENNGISANIIETSMMRCSYNWETKLLQWHVYDKKHYHLLIEYLNKNFKNLESPIDVFPVTIKSKKYIYDIQRYPCKIFYKSIKNNRLYVGMCEEKTGEIIIRYNLTDLR